MMGFFRTPREIFNITKLLLMWKVMYLNRILSRRLQPPPLIPLLSVRLRLANLRHCSVFYALQIDFIFNLFNKQINHTLLEQILGCRRFVCRSRISSESTTHTIHIKMADFFSSPIWKTKHPENKSWNFDFWLKKYLEIFINIV